MKLFQLSYYNNSIDDIMCISIFFISITSVMKRYQIIWGNGNDHLQMQKKKKYKNMFNQHNTIPHYT